MRQSGVIWALIHYKGVDKLKLWYKLVEIDTQRSFLIKNGPSSHVGVGRVSVGAGLLMISFQR